MQLDQFIDTIGFNKYEKEVILFLSGTNASTAAQVYKKTQIPKGRIYSVLNNLIDKGLVMVIPVSPKKYAIEDVRSVLKNYLKAEKNQLSKRIDQTEALELKPKEFDLENKAPSVYTFSGREAHLNALIELRNKAKKSLIQIAPIFTGTFSSNRALHKAVKRNVSVRIITRAITKANAKNIKECLRLGADVRVCNSPELVHFSIRDSQDFLLGLEDYRNKEERLVLISKNPGLRLSLEDFFEKMWIKSKKIKKSDLLR
jgi:sugar-specific transcriptional regulator TrmB